jgi:hypothetical protein
MERFPLLDIAIGLMLIYAFLSLLVSELTELMSRLLRWRSVQLQQGIMTLLGESIDFSQHPEQFKDSMVGRLYSSSLIAFISQRAGQSRRLVGPSSIPPLTFADALLEVLQTFEDGQQSQVLHEAGHLGGDLAKFLTILETSNQIPMQLKNDLRRLAEHTQSRTKETELQIEQFRQDIALWYEHSMDRVTTAYRRNANLFSVLIGFLIAVFINADSLYMFRRISENTATRSVIIENAIQIQGCQTDFSSESCLEKMETLLEGTTIPIGWHPINLHQQFPQRNLSNWLRAAIGWLLTSLAISMGSQFWFPVLEQFMEVRDITEKE